MEPEKTKDLSRPTAFISYRRSDGDGFARLLHEKLKQAGVISFYDVDSLRNGRFDINLLNSIDDCDNFILVLSKDSLNPKRLNDPKDFVRREIEYALKHKKNIVPVMLDGFRWEAVKKLPDSLSKLHLYNAISMHSTYNGNLFNAFVEDLIDMLVKPGKQIPDHGEDDPGNDGGGGGGSQHSRIPLYIGIGVLAAALIAAALIRFLPRGKKTPEPAAAPETNAVYVFSDENASENRYIWPLRLDGTNAALVHDIEMGCADGPHSGTGCIKSRIDTEEGSWGGWMLLNGYVPENGTARVPNDGETPGQGEDLTGATELRFYARGENGGEKVEFFCFGFGYDERNIPQNTYNDSAFKLSSGTIELSKKWTEYTVSIPAGTNLGNISCGFGFVCSGADNGVSENIIYLDDIRYCADQAF